MASFDRPEPLLIKAISERPDQTQRSLFGDSMKTKDGGVVPHPGVVADGPGGRLIVAVRNRSTSKPPVRQLLDAVVENI